MLRPDIKLHKLSPNNFYYNTGQKWKLVIMDVLILIGGILFLWGLIKVAGENTKEYDLWIQLAGMILIFCFLMWSFISLKCPKCKSHLVWIAATKRPFGEFGKWIGAIEKCPICGFDPSIPEETEWSR